MEEYLKRKLNLEHDREKVCSKEKDEDSLVGTWLAIPVLVLLTEIQIPIQRSSSGYY